MADVFLAEDQQLARQVAVKLLHRRFAEDPGFVERFRREAQSAASLQHPNVVSVFDRGAFDGTYYIAMEYLQGRSLKQLIRQEAPLEPLRAIDLTVQILKAARFAHRRGVIHRDLKPHNVIVDDNDHAKVTDFGIARAGASDMTETGSIMGTAQYLSPEQAQGHAVSAPSDLYSIGIVLYEMLTGRVPFDADSAVTIALKHVSEGPIPPRQINPAVPVGLEQVVMWSLNKSPGDRPADADEFIAALEQVRESLLAGGTGEVTANMAIVPAGMAAVGGQPPAALLPTAEAFGAGYAASGQQTNGGGPGGGESEEPGDHRDDKGGGIWPWVTVVLILLLLAGGAAAYLLTRPDKVQVPIVVSLSQSIAQARIEQVGLNPTPIYQNSPDQAGTVIDQSPLGGTHVDKGSTVTLTISNGPGNVDIPSIVQLPKDEAIRQLKSAGLKVARILNENSPQVPVGEATRTDPPAGSSVQSGSGVTLYLSSGRAPINVPYVTGDQLTAAQAVLGRFAVKVVNKPTDTASAGTVLSQTPAGNSVAKPGSLVTLTVASAPTTTKVPSVTGDTEVAASGTLLVDKLKAAVRFQTVTAANQDGIVIAQIPSANTVVPFGTTVTIVVGRYKAPTSTQTTTTHTSTSTATPSLPGARVNPTTTTPKTATAPTTTTATTSFRATTVPSATTTHKAPTTTTTTPTTTTPTTTTAPTTTTPSTTPVAPATPAAPANTNPPA
jgi:serine/threonine-protein kinase